MRKLIALLAFALMGASTVTTMPTDKEVVGRRRGEDNHQSMVFYPDHTVISKTEDAEETATWRLQYDGTLKITRPNGETYTYVYYKGTWVFYRMAKDL